MHARAKRKRIAARIAATVAVVANALVIDTARLKLAYDTMNIAMLNMTNGAENLLKARVAGIAADELTALETVQANCMETYHAAKMAVLAADKHLAWRKSDCRKYGIAIA